MRRGEDWGKGALLLTSSGIIKRCYCANDKRETYKGLGYKKMGSHKGFGKSGEFAGSIVRKTPNQIVHWIYGLRGGVRGEGYKLTKIRVQKGMKKSPERGKKKERGSPCLYL